MIDLNQVFFRSYSPSKSSSPCRVGSRWAQFCRTPPLICNGQPTGICDCSRSPSPFCSLIVRALAQSTLVLTGSGCMMSKHIDQWNPLRCCLTGFQTIILTGRIRFPLDVCVSLPPQMDRAAVHREKRRTHCIDFGQGTLSVRSVVLFQSSYSPGSVVHILNLLPPE